MSSYSGYMLADHAGTTYSFSQIGSSEPQVRGGASLVWRNQAFGLTRWGEYLLSSSIPLAEEPEGNQDGYNYQVLVARGEAKLLLLAARRRIIDFALSQILDRMLFPNLRKINVFIDPLIEHCSELDAQFLVTSLHGRFSGQARQIRSMSLYGDDVANSKVYLENKSAFNFHSCGLGRRLFDGLPRLRPNEEGEIVRVSYDGFINLNLVSRRQAQELTRVIDFIVKNRWVEDWVISQKGAK